MDQKEANGETGWKISGEGNNKCPYGAFESQGFEEPKKVRCVNGKMKGKGLRRQFQKIRKLEWKN